MDFETRSKSEDKTVQQLADEEEEEKFGPSAPMQRINFPTFLQYKDMIIQDCYHHYYVTSDWSPEFFRRLAYEGFICVTHDKFLIPEIQVYYGVLFFDKLHIAKKCKKYIKRYSSRLTQEINEIRSKAQWRLRFYESRNPTLCTSRIQAYWGSSNWLSDKYVKCMRESGLRVHTFELYLEKVISADFMTGIVVGCEEDGEVVIGSSRILIAGEIGYSIGSVYTSLTGYCEKEEITKPSDFVVNRTNQSDIPLSLFRPSATSANSAAAQPSVGENVINYNSASVNNYETIHIPKDLATCCGTIQLVCLGKWLQSYGYSFWNLGHPPRREVMKYKRDIGGEVYPRGEFLSLWQSARDTSPSGGDAFIPNEFDFNYIFSHAADL